MGFRDTVRELLHELRSGAPSGVYGLVTRQVYREWYAYGLRRQVDMAFKAPKARIPIAIRKLQDSDVSHLFEEKGQKMSRQSRLEIAHRRSFLAERVPTPYVAIDLRSGRPCFLQWLMTAQSNDVIQGSFCGRFPVLAHDEGLLEYAYTPTEYRGNGIMPAAMALITEMAGDVGIRSVMTFVLRENAAALQGCSKAGFVPFAVRRDRHFLFRLIRRRSVTALREVVLQEGVLRGFPPTEGARQTLLEGRGVLD